MRIAICDDEKSDIELIQKYCEQYSSDFSISSFICGEDLLIAFKNEYFDLVFLDIEMGKMNGLEVGRQLAKLQPRPVVIITTQSLNYAVRGYGIALRYLLKPITYDTFCHIMRLALDHILPYRLNVVINKAQIFIPICDIVFFEVLRHQVVIHLRAGEVLSMRGSLSDIMAQIPSGQFSQPHKSYYINMDYVDKLMRQEIILTNGARIPVGRSRKEVFQSQLLDYMKGNHSNEFGD